MYQPVPGGQDSPAIPCHVLYPAVRRSARVAYGGTGIRFQSVPSLCSTALVSNQIGPSIPVFVTKKTAQRPVAPLTMVGPLTGRREPGSVSTPINVIASLGDSEAIMNLAYNQYMKSANRSAPRGTRHFRNGSFMPNVQLTNGGPPATPESPRGSAGPPFGAVLGSTLGPLRSGQLARLKMRAK